MMDDDAFDVFVREVERWAAQPTPLSGFHRLRQLLGERHLLSSDGRMARCPAHGGDSLSLQLFTNERGDGLIVCLQGCTARQVLDALGVDASAFRGSV